MNLSSDYHRFSSTCIKHESQEYSGYAGRIKQITDREKSKTLLFTI